MLIGSPHPMTCGCKPPISITMLAGERTSLRYLEVGTDWATEFGHGRILKLQFAINRRFRIRRFVREMVNVQDAVKVADLVRDYTSLVTFKANLLILAVFVKIVYGYLISAHHISLVTPDRHARFALDVFLSGGRNDRRVNQDQILRFRVACWIYNSNCLLNADLRCRQPDANRVGPQRIGKVLNQAVQVFVKRLNRFGGRSQQRFVFRRSACRRALSQFSYSHDNLLIKREPAIRITSSNEPYSA